MKSLLHYLLQVMACSGVLYGYYHFFLRNKRFHIYNRFYLLIAATISILVPFLNIPVYFSAGETNSSILLKTITAITSNDFVEPPSVSSPDPIKNSPFSTGNLLFGFYILISLVLVTRTLFALKKIWQIKRKYTVQKLNAIYFVNTTEPGTPFSFFRWLFWNEKIELRSEKGEQIFRHELFHIEQKHSLDIIYLEFLITIFWMNPFLHLIKKETKVIHEFLADQFAINQGGKWEYAELLLMQSLNTGQHLTNPFFYNQIKRRIAMITSSQKTRHKYLRKIMVLPVAVFVIALFAFSYKNKKVNNSSFLLDKPVRVVIDAGHGIDATGQYTGAAADDSHEDDIVLSIAQKIKELNSNARLQILLTRENKNTVDLKKRVEFCNSQNADLFISLHLNAASKQERNSKGIDILYSGKNVPYYAANKILATILYNYFYQIRPANQIQTPNSNVYVIDNSPCPSVMLECGYMTDPNDLSFVKTETGQTQIAKSVLQSIEQYFMQKQTQDWEERKRIVSDTASPVVIFNRNAVTGKMEGSYNGKKFNKLTDYNGQFAFVFDDEQSSMIMISKEQTEALKKKYGKDLDELLIKYPDQQKAGGKEQQALKEVLEEKQMKSEKAESELRQLLAQKQMVSEKQELELNQTMTMRQLEQEKADLELKELMNLKQQENQGRQLELKKRMDTLQSKDSREEALKKLQLLINEQRDTEKMQKEFEQMILLKQLESEKNGAELKELLIKQKEKELNHDGLKKMQQEREEKAKDPKKVKS